MRSSIIVSAFALVASVSAITLTFPKEKNATLDLSVSNEITWNAVSTDPTTVSIALVNRVMNPPTTLVLSKNVTTSDGKYTLAPLTGPEIGAGYQINLYKPIEADQKEASIAVQSEQFSISKVAAKDAVTPSKTDGAATVSETAGAPAATTSKPSSAGALKVTGWGLVVAGLVATLL